MDSQQSTPRLRVFADFSSGIVEGVVGKKIVESLGRFSEKTATRAVTQASIAAITENLLRATCERKTRGDVLLVPIMRAGLAMLHPASNYLGSPETSFLMGIRDKNTGEATVSWLKRSSMVDKQHIVILDPLIATGGTLHGAFKVLRDYSSDHPPITVFSCYASPEGIRSVLEEGRNITLVVGCVAESMDKNGWLSPPTNGDVGDKLYGPVLTG